MEIRQLKTSDVFTVIGMLKKISNTKLSNLFVSDTESKEEKSDDNQSVQLGIMVLTELYENVIGDLQEWFASLINKTVEEYMEMPVNTTLDIIDFLVEDPGAKGFFSRALQLYKKIKPSGSGSKKK
jgi:hypothetical protein